MLGKTHDGRRLHPARLRRGLDTVERNPIAVHFHVFADQFELSTQTLELRSQRHEKSGRIRVRTKRLL